MKTIKALIIGGICGLGFVAISLGGPYPGQLKDHGHSASGDGGLISSFRASTRMSVGGSSITVNGFTTNKPVVVSTLTTDTNINLGRIPLSVRADTAAVNAQWLGRAQDNVSEIQFRNFANTSNIGFIDVGDSLGTTEKALDLYLNNTQAVHVSTNSLYVGGSSMTTTGLFGNDIFLQTFQTFQILSINTFASVASSATVTTIYVNSNITLTLTPKSPNSTFLVFGNLLGSPGVSMQFQLVRNSTALTTGNFAATNVQSVPFFAYDSPATAAAVTYKIQFKSSSGASVTMGDGSDTQSITVIEFLQ